MKTEKKEECIDQKINIQHLHGKNVVVIGGSKGVGRAIVGATHAQGAQVLAVARKGEPLNELAAASQAFAYSRLTPVMNALLQRCLPHCCLIS